METTNETTIEATPALKLEVETCSRCGGSGTYSFHLRYGTVCFRCNGAKTTYTKRGAAAKRFLTELRSRPASELKPGDRIYTTGITVGGEVYGQKSTVESISAGIRQGASMKDGVMVAYRDECLEIQTTNVRLCGVMPDSLYYVIPATRAEGLEQLRKAVEYQGTLTKQGKPLKRVALKA